MHELKSSVKAVLFPDIMFQLTPTLISGESLDFGARLANTSSIIYPWVYQFPQL